MKKYLVGSILLVTVLIFAVPYSVKYWPSGKYSDIAFIWLHQDDMSKLLELANQSGYERIMWSYWRDTMRVYVDGKNVEVEWAADPKFSSIAAHAESFGLTWFHGRIYKGQWVIFGSPGEIREENRSGQINRAFSNSIPKHQKHCDDVAYMSVDSGSCYVHLFGDWYLEEQWFKYPPIEL